MSTSISPNEPPPPYTETQEDVDIVAQSLTWLPPPPPLSQQFPPLNLPIAIPQIQPNKLISGNMPFLRAYSQPLSQHSISVEEFVRFIDSITIALSPTAPFQVVKAASMGLGAVPHHWFQVASGVVGLAADVGSAATIAARSRLYLKKVNSEFFAPRGLKVAIMTDKELRGVIGEDEENPRIAPYGQSTTAITLTERRLLGLEGAVAPLTFEVPPPEQREKFLDQLAAKGVLRKTRKSRRAALKEARSQGVQLSAEDLALLSSESDDDSDSSLSSDDESELEQDGNGKVLSDKKTAKMERKRERRLAKRARRELKDAARKERKEAKVERKEVKRADKKIARERKQIAKLKWLMIQNLSQS